MPVMRAEGREGYAKLEPGKAYWFRVIEANSKYSQRTGDDQIQLILNVGDKSGTAKIYETLTFSEKAYFRIEHFLKATGKYPGDGVDIYFDENDVVNLSGRCTIKYEPSEKNGKEYPRIDEWLFADRQEPVKEWIERAKYNSRKAQAEDGYSTEPINSDDIPF